MLYEINFQLHAAKLNPQHALLAKIITRPHLKKSTYHNIFEAISSNQLGVGHKMALSNGELHCLKADHNNIYRARIGSEQAIVKIYGSPYGWLREALCLRHLKRKKVNFIPLLKHSWCLRSNGIAPSVIYANVLELVDGTTLDAWINQESFADSALVFMQLGQLTQSLHKFSHWNVIKQATKRFKRWSLFENSLFDVLPLYTAGLLQRNDIIFIERQLDKALDDLGLKNNVMVHDDIARSNVIVKRDAGYITLRIIDFEFCHLGNAIVDLFWIYHYYRPYFMNFLMGYGMEYSKQLKIVLKSLYYLYQSTWPLQRYPTMPRPFDSCSGKDKYKVISLPNKLSCAQCTEAKLLIERACVELKKLELCHESSL